MDELKRLKTSRLERTTAVLRLTTAIGVKTALRLATKRFGDEGSRATRWDAFLREQADYLADELGKLKGGIMKAGQMLAVYGEHFFPPEVNVLLRRLHADTAPVAFAVVDQALRSEIGQELRSQLQVEPEPFAAASIGQVHRARWSKEPKELALKIQYPGVAAAIDADLARLRTILGVLRLVPSGPAFDAIFTEVRAMLHREVDYERELAALLATRARLSTDPRFVVPRPIPALSTGRVLALELETGQRVDGPEVQALPQARRDRLGSVILELFFQEFFVWRVVQTDPHFGNYAIRLVQGERDDQWILYDFGAVREFPPDFLRTYYTLIHAGLTEDRGAYETAATNLKILRSDDSVDVKRLMYDLGRLVLEPFSSDEPYDWGGSDLPRRVVDRGLALLGSRPRAPAEELVFLDRKLAGVFTLLSTLKARIAGRAMLCEHLARHGFVVP